MSLSKKAEYCYEISLRKVAAQAEKAEVAKELEAVAKTYEAAKEDIERRLRSYDLELTQLDNELNAVFEAPVKQPAQTPAVVRPPSRHRKHWTEEEKQQLGAAVQKLLAGFKGGLTLYRISSILEVNEMICAKVLHELVARKELRRLQVEVIAGNDSMRKISGYGLSLTETVVSATAAEQAQ
jgi:hypothetical protein